MKAFDSHTIKNIAILGHSGSGKTIFTETMLFEAGEITRRGTIEGKNTASDYHEVEMERGNSVIASLLHLNWKASKINIIDTPGLDDFAGEVVAAMKVADSAVMMINAQQGVEVGTELNWEYVEEHQKPAVFVVNQVDQDKSDFEMSLDQIKERIGNKVLQMQYPYNQGNGFNAIIDCLKMVMYEFGPDGGKPEKKPIPDSEKAKADELHNAIVESAAENDEELMEHYFEKGTLSEEELIIGLKMGFRTSSFYPVFCCSAKNNMGSGRVLGFLHNVAPSPASTEPTELDNGESLACDSKGKPVAFIYKTQSEPNIGELYFFKVCSGTLKSGLDLTNLSSSNSERLNQLFVVNGKTRTQVDELGAGDIGVTVKLKHTHTNTTLAEKGFPASVKQIEFPNPKIRVAVKPPNKADMEKLVQALHHIENEDPTIVVEQSKELRQTLIHAQGALHLQMLKWKIEHVYKLQIEFEKPKIPYRETITRAAKTDYRHKKQSGGSGQFAEVHFLIEPYHEGMPAPADLTVRQTEETELEWGGKLVFNNCIVGGSIDNRFMGAIQKGIMQKMIDGPLTGSYCRDVRVSVYDGKMHPVDSNDMAFMLASNHAFKQSFKEAGPQIMEPIYDVEIMVAEEATGDVMSDLQSRRAIIQGISTEGSYQKILARVPLAELYQYSSSLRSMSQGKAKFSRKFADYAAVPHDIQKELIKDHESNSSDS